MWPAVMPAANFKKRMELTMKINWKLRVLNPATIIAIAANLVMIIYTVLGFFGIVPAVTQNEIMNVVQLIVEILVMLGIVVDPTTSGLSDSERALNYEAPYSDKETK